MSGQCFFDHAHMQCTCMVIECFPVTKRELFADHLTIIHPMTSCATFVNIHLTINQNLCMQKHQNTRWVYAYVNAIRVQITHNMQLHFFVYNTNIKVYILCTVRVVAFSSFFRTISNHILGDVPPKFKKTTLAELFFFWVFFRPISDFQKKKTFSKCLTYRPSSETCVKATDLVDCTV